ncbi:hypothetical protein CRM90_16395 [Mycobacterium sp. ENV421]|nr:hypothetical protein CRM90_16395 [Mycobacterium sp. ENV421]
MLVAIGVTQQVTATSDVSLLAASTQLINVNGAFDNMSPELLSCTGCDQVDVVFVEQALAVASFNTADKYTTVVVVAYGSDAAELGSIQTQLYALPGDHAVVLMRDTNGANGMRASLGLVKATPTDIADNSAGPNGSAMASVRLQGDGVVDAPKFLVGPGAGVAWANAVIGALTTTQADYNSFVPAPDGSNRVITPIGNGSTSDVLLLRQAPLITSISGIPVIGHQLATVLTPAINDVLSVYDPAGSQARTQLLLPWNEQVALIGRIPGDIQQGFDGLHPQHSSAAVNTLAASSAGGLHGTAAAAGDPATVTPRQAVTRVGHDLTRLSIDTNDSVNDAVANTLTAARTSRPKAGANMRHVATHNARAARGTGHAAPRAKN